MKRHLSAAVNSLAAKASLLCVISYVAFIQVGFSQISGSERACVNVTETYSTSTEGAFYDWQVNRDAETAVSEDGKTIEVTWPSAGDYTASLTITDASGIEIATYSLLVSVLANPAPLITPEFYLSCDGDLFGRVEHRETTSSGGLIVDDRGEIDVVEYISVCDSSSMKYSIKNNTGSNYLWKVNGGNIIGANDAPEVLVFWASVGYGDIKVIETNINGCTDSTTWNIAIIETPKTAFEVDENICVGAPANFTNHSIVEDQPSFASPYLWDFGDGTTSSEENPIHTYSSAGTYIVTLITRNDCNCKDTFRTEIVVDPTPAVEIVCPSTVCAGETTSYTTPAENCEIYFWDAEGGSIVSGQGTDSIIVEWGNGERSAGVISLYVEGCESSNYCNDTTEAIIPIVPADTDIQGPKVVCRGESIEYSLPGDPVPGTYYEWQVSGSAKLFDRYGLNPSSGIGVNKVTVDWASYGPGTVSVNYFNDFLECGGGATIEVDSRESFIIRSLGFGYGSCIGDQMEYYTMPGLPANWSIEPATAGTVISGNGTDRVVIEWNEVGAQTVTADLIDRDLTCNFTKSREVEVYPIPEPVENIIGPRIVCSQTNYKYTVDPELPGQSYRWNVTNGAIVTGNYSPTVTVSWGSTGPYGLSVMASEEVCFSDPISITIEGIEAVNPDILGPDNVCLNDTIAYILGGDLAEVTNIEWILDSGSGTIISGQSSEAVEIAWNTIPGTVNLSVNIEMCGTNFSTSKSVVVNPQPEPIISAGTLCPGSTTFLSADQAYDYYSWSFEGNVIFEGSNYQTITASDSGLYRVRVSNAYGCIGQANYLLEPAPGAIALITSPDPRRYCPDQTVSSQLYTPYNSGYSYQWYRDGSMISSADGGTDNPFTATEIGRYEVVATNAYGCQSSDYFSIVRWDCESGGGSGGTCTPEGSVSIEAETPVCNPVSFDLTASNVSDFYWDFDNDGTTDYYSVTPEDPTFKYKQVGYNRVEVQATSTHDNCYPPYLYAAISVRIPLVAAFKYEKGCVGANTCFTDESLHLPDETITGHTWYFGDGTTSTAENPCHTYSAPGNYQVILEITNNTCTVSDTQTVVIDPLPDVAMDLSTSTGCEETPMQFSGISALPRAHIDRWEWNFGDGITSNSQNTAHTYAATGTYPVSLSLINVYGCSNTITENLTVNPNNGTSDTIVYNGSATICKGSFIDLTAPSGSYYKWSTGATTQTITVDKSGSYEVSYINGDGCLVTTDPIEIHATGPTAEIYGEKQRELCDKDIAGRSSRLNLYARYNGCYVYKWTHLESGTIVSTRRYYLDYSATPAESGTYQLVVTDICDGRSCTDTATVQVIIHPAPERPRIFVQPDIVCEGENAVLTVDNYNSDVSYFWNNGETGQSITVTPPKGYHPFSVSAYNSDNGCTVSSNPYGSSPAWLNVDPLIDMSLFMSGCYEQCGPQDTLYFPNSWSYDYVWLLNGEPVGNPNRELIVTESGDYQIQVNSRWSHCSDISSIMSLNLIECCKVCLPVPFRLREGGGAGNSGSSSVE